MPDDDITGHDGNVESEGKVDSSSNELNEGSSENSQEGIDDVDQKSIGSTEAPDSEMVGGVHDNSNLPVSESPVTHLKEEDDDDGNDDDDDDGEDDGDDDDDDDDSDGGTVTKDQGDDVSVSAVPANEEESTGDQSASDAEHAAGALENMEEVATEVNKNDNTETDNEEHDVSQGDDSDTDAPVDTHHALGSSSEDDVTDQSNSAEGNNSGVSEPSTQGMKEEDDGVDDHDIPKVGDSGTDTSGDVDQGTSSEVGTEDQNLSVETSSQIGGSSIIPTTEINAQNFIPGARSHNALPPVPSPDNITYTDVPATIEISQTAGNESNIAYNGTENLGKDEDRQSGTLVETAVTTSVPGSGNNTLSGTRVQKENIKQGGDEGINEPRGSPPQKDSESSGSIGSYIVLGVIMAIIIVLLGYSVFKGRGQREHGENIKDIEMKDVTKRLLKQNECQGVIIPNTRLEDESKTKLLLDAQHEGDNVHNGEAGVAVQNGVDSQKALGGFDDALTEKKFNFDGNEAQLEHIDASQNSLNSHYQNSTNPFREPVTPKKQETADGQTTHHYSPKTPTRQRAYNNVNGVSEAVVEKVPVQKYSGYVTQNPAIHFGLQQENMGIEHSSQPPIKVKTVVEEGCVPTKPIIVNVERNVFQY